MNSDMWFDLQWTLKGIFGRCYASLKGYSTWNSGFILIGSTYLALCFFMDNSNQFGRFPERTLIRLLSVNFQQQQHRRLPEVYGDSIYHAFLPRLFLYLQNLYPSLLLHYTYLSLPQEGAPDNVVLFPPEETQSAMVNEVLEGFSMCVGSCTGSVHGISTLTTFYLVINSPG